MNSKIEGINIFSGAATELGAALTNPTELARQKGCVSKRYDIRFTGKAFADVESAYHLLAMPDSAERDTLMAELIAAKFKQHPELYRQVTDRGGEAFLTACSHWTAAKSEGAQAWEGQGTQSRFIRNLIRGFLLAEQDALTENGQRGLF